MSWLQLENSLECPQDSYCADPMFRIGFARFDGPRERRGGRWALTEALACSNYESNPCHM